MSAEKWIRGGIAAGLMTGAMAGQPDVSSGMPNQTPDNASYEAEMDKICHNRAHEIGGFSLSIKGLGTDDAKAFIRNGEVPETDSDCEDREVMESAQGWYVEREGSRWQRISRTFTVRPGDSYRNVRSLQDCDEGERSRKLAVRFRFTTRKEGDMIVTNPREDYIKSIGRVAC